MAKNNVQSAQAGASSIYVVILTLAVFAMAYVVFVPSFFKVRDSVTVELAARAMATCDDVLKWKTRENPEFDRASCTIAEINDYLKLHERPAIKWTERMDLSSFCPTGELASIEIFVRGGKQRVTAE